MRGRDCLTDSYDQLVVRDVEVSLLTGRVQLRDFHELLGKLNRLRFRFEEVAPEPGEDTADGLDERSQFDRADGG